MVVDDCCLWVLVTIDEAFFCEEDVTCWFTDGKAAGYFGETAVGQSLFSERAVG